MVTCQIWLFLWQYLISDDELKGRKRRKLESWWKKQYWHQSCNQFIIDDNIEPVKQVTNSLQLDGSNHLKEDTITDHREVRQIQFSHSFVVCIFLFSTLISQFCLAYSKGQIHSLKCSDCIRLCWMKEKLDSSLFFWNWVKIFGVFYDFYIY